LAERVFLHIGLPKTGTTYLQGILWGSRKSLAADGYVMPGRKHRHHLWGALEVLERPGLARRDPRAPGTWGRLVAEVEAAAGTAIISHEFLCGAGRSQAGRAVSAFGAAEVHIVVTARDSLGMLTAGWQESVKNGGTDDLEAIAARKGRGPGSEFSWRTWDLGGVLRRWSPHVAPEHVHVLPMPDRAVSAPDQHWRNLAAVLGLDPDRYPAPDDPANPTLGATEVELLRRVNGHLSGFDTAVDRGDWIRGYLAEHRLAQLSRDRPRRPIAVPPDLVADAVRRAERAVAAITAHGFDVRGDVDRLRVRPPATASPGEPETPSDTELADAAAHLVADMLHDVRELSAGNVTTARSGHDRGPGAGADN
jgi:hypothetical protein